MPTKKRRIPVIEDATLGAALGEVAAYYPPNTSKAKLLRDLALRGAETVAQEKTEEDERIERLIAFSTQRQDLVDWEVLERIDELAWGE